MTKQFQVNTSIQGGTLRFYLYKVSNHAPVGTVEDNNALTINLTEGESYVMGYQVISKSANCTYTVSAKLNGISLWNISTVLGSGDIDYNAQKFSV